MASCFKVIISPISVLIVTLLVVLALHDQVHFYNELTITINISQGLSTRIRIVIRIEVEFPIFAFDSNQSHPYVLLHNANSVMTIKFTM